MTDRPGHVQRLAATLAGSADRVTRVVLIAPDGAGRSEALDALEELLAERAVGLVRITGRRADRDEPLRALRSVLADDVTDERAARDALRAGLGDDRVLLVLDDAHWADDASLRVVAALVEESDALGVVATHRPTPSEGLGALDAAMARRGAIIRVEALSEDDVAERASAVLGAPVEPGLADELHARTGGNARLVDRLVAARDAPEPVPPALVELVRAAAGDLSASARDALTTLCLATAVDDELLAAVVGVDAQAVRDLFAELSGAGLLLPGHDEPIPVVAEAVAAGHDAAAARDTHRRIAELLRARGAPATQVAEHLVAGGSRGPEAADVLVAAGRAVLPEAPTEAVRLLDDAAAAGADADSIAGLRAEANALAGDEDRALSLVDAVGGSPESVARATVVLGSLLARRGLWGQAEQAYRSAYEHPTLPPDAITSLAAVCAVAGGRPPDAAGPGDPTPAGLGADIARLLGRSAIAAGAGDADGALHAAGEAAELVSVAGATVVLPETPHVIGAAVALATGDVDDASRFVALAVDSGAGGPAAAARHHLLGGLASLRAGRWDHVTIALDAAGSGSTTRDAFLAGALRVGLARRVGDVGGLHEAWDELSAPLAAVRGDLFLLLPLAEVMVAAGRLGRRDQTRPRERELVAVLDGLGHPALWARPFAWARVEAAIAAGDLAGVDAAADALASVPAAHERLEGLEAAAAAWRAVLAGETDSTAVLDGGVAALERAGLVWEASRIVGQAAIRAGDPRETRALLGRARELKGTLPVVDEAGVPVGTVLSAREQEVASGVLDGLTHKEIGAILFISPKTVEHHVARIRQKLGASTRAEMLAGLRATLA